MMSQLPTPDHQPSNALPAVPGQGIQGNVENEVPNVDASVLTLEEKLNAADELEEDVSKQFLEASRPRLVAGHRLPWDRFWRWFSGGFDGLLWRWVSDDVRAAQVREASASSIPRKKEGGAKKMEHKSPTPPPRYPPSTPPQE